MHLSDISILCFQSEIECSGYGRSRVSVQDAITQHEKISQEIQDYKTTVDSTLKTLTSQDATENIEKQYADLLVSSAGL